MTDEITVVVRGGLGNQMFQAAYGAELAKHFDRPIRFIDLTAAARQPRRWELDCFNLEPKRISALQTRLLRMRLAAARRLQALGHGLPGTLLDADEPIDLRCVKGAPSLVSGYWQRPSCFATSEAEVRDRFKFPQLPPDLRLARIPGEAVAAIHVRRGDYANDPTARQNHLVCDTGWYRRAWDFVRDRVPNCRGVVFSDDERWVASELKLPGRVELAKAVPSAPPWVDMARMASCDHFVISNSTYGWWAAYLSAADDKIVVAPRRWFTNVETSALGICPSEWILL